MSVYLLGLNIWWRGVEKKILNFCPPVKVPSYLVNKEQRRLFAQKSAGEGDFISGSPQRERLTFFSWRRALCTLTLLRSPRGASAGLHLFFPPSICVLTRLAFFFLPPHLHSHHSQPYFSLPHLQLPSLPPLLLQSLALFDWTLSQDSPSRVQVKLLIASAAGGEERLAHCSSASPCSGGAAAGIMGGWGGDISMADWSRQCMEAGDKGLLNKMVEMTPDSSGLFSLQAPTK